MEKRKKFSKGESVIARIGGICYSAVVTGEDKDGIFYIIDYTNLSKTHIKGELVLWAQIWGLDETNELKEEVRTDADWNLTRIDDIKTKQSA